MSIEELQAHLRDAHERIGNFGRFSFTINQDSYELQPIKGKCYITHWFRPTPYAFEDCRSIGSGSAEECLESLDAYVEQHIQTNQQVGISTEVTAENPPVHIAQ